MNEDHILAHKHSSSHRSEIEKSAVCGCFYCLAIFPPSEIDIWIDDDQTALCPKCPVDSVIGSASGYPITTEFLQRMHDHWFSSVPELKPASDRPRNLAFIYYTLIGYGFRAFSVTLALFCVVFIAVYIASLFSDAVEHYPPAALLVWLALIVGSFAIWHFGSFVLRGRVVSSK